MVIGITVPYRLVHRKRIRDQGCISEICQLDCCLRLLMKDTTLCAMEHQGKVICHGCDIPPCDIHAL